MSAFTGKNIVVIGGSRGVGWQVVKAAARGGGRVLAVAREQGPLDALKRDMPGVEILALNASDERAPARVFEGAVVFGTGCNPGLLRLGLEILQRLPADPDFSQRSARLRRIHPNGCGSAVEGALHPPA